MAISSQHLGELQQMVLLAVSTLGTDAWSASVSRCLARERGTAVSDSVIYATLKRLTDKGLLAMELAQPTERRRGRRRSSRKYWCGLTTITQDVRDALSSDIGRTVLTNASMQVLLGQHPQSLPALAEAFDLSKGEASFLGASPAGRGLLCLGAQRAALEVIASPQEHAMVTSNPAELAAEAEPR